MRNRYPSDPSITSWGKPAVGGIGVIAGYGVATGTPSVSASYSDGGFTWKRIDFTSSSSLVVSTAGLFDVLALSGGGGGGMATTGGNAEGGGGGSASQLIIDTFYIPAGTYTVTIGGGGANADSNTLNFGGATGITTLLIAPMPGIAGAGPWYPGQRSYNGSGASYRGGYGGSAGGSAVGAYGYSGAGSDGAGNNGGGGGTGGAGGTRTAGAGTTSTFTGTSTTYGSGGLGGGSSGTFGGSGTANTGNGGGGGISNATAGGTGGSGFVCVRWRIA